MNFYDRVKELCENRGIAVSAAVMAAGLSKATASKWKKNPDVAPTGETMQKLAKYFGVSVGYLTGTEAPELDLSAFPEIYRIARAGTKMPLNKREELLNFAKYLVPEAFDD